MNQRKAFFSRTVAISVAGSHTTLGPPDSTPWDWESKPLERPGKANPQSGPRPSLERQAELASTTQGGGGCGEAVASCSCC